MAYGTPHRSPDGAWWWDGMQWRPTHSPDGRWRWDGGAWQPVGPPTPVAPLPPAPGPPAALSPPYGPTPGTVGPGTAPAVPAPRSRRRTALVVVAAAVVLVAAVGGALALALGGGTTAFPGKTPAQVNEAVYAAATAGGTFHYVNHDVSEVGGTTLRLEMTGDVGPGTGIQDVSGSGGDFEILVTGSVAYLKADATALKETFGYDAATSAQYAGTWIAIASDESPYEAVAALVTSESFWGNPQIEPMESLPATPSAVADRSTVDGRAVQSVTSTIHDSDPSTGISVNGTTELTFAADDPHLPLRSTGRTSSSGEGSTGTDRYTTTFSSWGEPVHITAPSGAVPYSSLPAPSTGQGGQGGSSITT